jgi:hypothetical protein
MDNFLADKESWINSRAPGSTLFDSEYIGSKQNNSNPTFGFLQGQENANEDVELFVYDTLHPEVVHAITLTGAKCDQALYGGCAITYQDPNAPNQQQLQLVTKSTGGALQITGLPGTGYLTDPFQIYAAFAESPIPEPAAWALMLAGLAAIGAALRRPGVDVRSAA